MPKRGLAADLLEAQFRSVYEHLCDTSQLVGAAFGTHFVDLAYILARGTHTEPRPG